MSAKVGNIIIYIFPDESHSISHVIFLYISSKNAHFNENCYVYFHDNYFEGERKRTRQCCSVRPYYSSLEDNRLAPDSADNYAKDSNLKRNASADRQHGLEIRQNLLQKKGVLPGAGLQKARQ